MIQQGQAFKLKTKGPDGEPLWAYRYRLEGRGSEKPQVGGFATRAEAERALRKVLDRFGPGGERATITLAGFVDEYSEMNEAAPVTIAKLRWLLVATQLTPPGGIIEYPEYMRSHLRWMLRCIFARAGECERCSSGSSR